MRSSQPLGSLSDQRDAKHTDEGRSGREAIRMGLELNVIAFKKNEPALTVVVIDRKPSEGCWG